MRHARPILLNLLASLLFLQAGFGALHCLRAMDRSMAIICSIDGTQAVAVADDTDPAAARMASGFCAACHALPALPVPPSPQPLGTVVWAPFPPDGFVRDVAPHPPARAPPLLPRAPPILA